MRLISTGSRTAACAWCWPQVHAGTARQDGQLVTNGGRVLGVTALGASYEAARERAYQAAAIIDFEGKYHRTDIAQRAVEAEQRD